MKKCILVVLLSFWIANTISAQKIFLPTNKTTIEEYFLWQENKVENTGKLGKFISIIPNDIVLYKIYNEMPNTFTLQIINKSKQIVNILFTIKKIEPVRIKINNETFVNDILIPISYSGKVIDMLQNNNIALTLAPNFISLQAKLPNELIAIERENKLGSNIFIKYSSVEIKMPILPFSCGTKDNLDYKPTSNLIKNTASSFSSIDKCVYAFIDCTDSLFIHNSSNVQNTINYIYSIWNDVHTAFLNEQINMKISEINIWKTLTPFNLTTRALALETFSAHYQNNYWGNMALLLDWSTSGRAGVAGFIGAIKAMAPNVCGNYNANPTNAGWHGSFIYNDLNYFGNYSNFPTVALERQVYSTVHEIGHLLSSAHTHWCGWPGGAIDNCAVPEGTCATGPSMPTSGGTFMSYCIGTGQVMNFNNGFGPLPGAAIRNFVNNNTCIANCFVCIANTTVGNIGLGYTEVEVSNQITANGIVAGGVTKVKLDAAHSIILAPGFRAPSGSKVNAFIDGCGGNR
jgi:hypothetical protein